MQIVMYLGLSQFMPLKQKLQNVIFFLLLARLETALRIQNKYY